MSDHNLLPLRDIHLPPPPSSWPPAWEWWAILALVVVVLVGLVFSIRRYRQQRLRRLALRELRQLARQLRQQGESPELLAELSRFCRRLMVYRYGYQAATALYGEEWLQRLDQELGGSEFTAGVGRVLATGPYQRQPLFEGQPLLKLIGRLTRQMVRGGGA